MELEKNVLPVDFDGVFRFTNATDEDFIGRWNNIAYVFPAQKTSPMLIQGATPEEVQTIRKKFAKELAEREFYKSEKLKAMEKGTGIMNSIFQAPTYAPADLEVYIQQCLTPLPTGRAVAEKILVEPMENKLSRDEDGELRTVAVDKKVSLTKGAKNV